LLVGHREAGAMGYGGGESNKLTRVGDTAGVTSVSGLARVHGRARDQLIGAWAEG